MSTRKNEKCIAGNVFFTLVAIPAEVNYKLLYPVLLNFKSSKPYEENTNNNNQKRHNG